MEVVQGNPIIGKEFQEQAKEEDSLLPLLRITQEHQADSHSIYAEKPGTNSYRAWACVFSLCDPT